MSRITVYPCPHTFFTSQSSLHFLKFKKKHFTVLVCLLFDGLWPLEMVNLPPPLSTHININTSNNTHLCSFVCLVFHFRHTPQKQRGKLESNSLKHFPGSVSEPESLRRLDSWLLSLIMPWWVEPQRHMVVVMCVCK